jgi:hypothetical protein
MRSLSHTPASSNVSLPTNENRLGRFGKLTRNSIRKVTGCFTFRLSPVLVGSLVFSACGSSLDLPEQAWPQDTLSVPSEQKKTESACDTSGLSPSGYTIIGGDQVIFPSCPSKKPIGEALGFNGRHVLFVNYDGVDLRVGDSSMENQGIRDSGFKNQGIVTIDPFDPKNSKRLEELVKVHKQVQAWYSDYDVDVVLSRPLSGDYQMTVVGGDKTDIGLGGGIVGISPGDCKNNSETNLNFAFSRSLRENGAQVSVTIAHEAGHAYGLGHVQNNKDIMYPSVTNAEGFLGGLAADAGPCGFKPGDYQDSKKVLTENLGERQGEKPGNAAPPTLNILRPTDGASVEKDVELAVDAKADRGLDHITLSLSKVENGEARGAHPVAELRPPQSVARVRLTTTGTYQLTATAYDRVGNFAFSTVRFTSGTPTCAIPNDCAPGQKCENNTCVTPPVPAPNPSGTGDDHLRPIGQACEQSTECKDGICAITPVGQICTHYCNPDRLCAGSLECVDGICLPPMYSKGTPKPGTFGGKCTRNQDCGSGECSAPTEDPKATRYCTKVCDPALGWACPSSMECVQTDGATGPKNRCMIKKNAAGESGEAGGCSVTGPVTGSASGTGGTPDTEKRNGQSSFFAFGAAVLLGLWAIQRRRRLNPAL